MVTRASHERQLRHATWLRCGCTAMPHGHAAAVPPSVYAAARSTPRSAPARHGARAAWHGSVCDVRVRRARATRACDVCVCACACVRAGKTAARAAGASRTRTAVARSVYGRAGLQRGQSCLALCLRCLLRARRVGNGPSGAPSVPKGVLTLREQLAPVDAHNRPLGDPSCCEAAQALGGIVGAQAHLRSACDHAPATRGVERLFGASRRRRSIGWPRLGVVAQPHVDKGGDVVVLFVDLVRCRQTARAGSKRFRIRLPRCLRRVHVLSARRGRRSSGRRSSGRRSSGRRSSGRRGKVARVRRLLRRRRHGRRSSRVLLGRLTSSRCTLVQSRWRQRLLFGLHEAQQQAPEGSKVGAERHGWRGSCNIQKKPAEAAAPKLPSTTADDASPPPLSKRKERSARRLQEFQEKKHAALLEPAEARWQCGSQVGK